jgi:hypothetical protein
LKLQWLKTDKYFLQLQDTSSFKWPKWRKIVQIRCQNMIFMSGILTAISGSSTSLPKNFFCCSLLPAIISGTCCQHKNNCKYSVLYHPTALPVLLFMLKLCCFIHTFCSQILYRNPHTITKYGMIGTRTYKQIQMSPEQTMKYQTHQWHRFNYHP